MRTILPNNDISKPEVYNDLINGRKSYKKNREFCILKRDRNEQDDAHKVVLEILYVCYERKLAFLINANGYKFTSPISNIQSVFIEDNRIGIRNQIIGFFSL